MADFSRMHFAVLVILLIASVNAIPQGFVLNEKLNDDWLDYKIKFAKKYDEFTELARRLIWEDNLKYIQQHNIEYDLGKHTYHLGINDYSDMTFEEFRKIYLGSKPTARNSTSTLFLPPENAGNLPQFVDWRTQGYVTEVKNQGQCGSCWAFSSTGSLEGQNYRKTKVLVSFSEQQLMDCSRSFGNNGCNGGFMDKAFLYVKQYGIESEASYPYKAIAGNCQYDASKVVGHCKGFKDIARNSEGDLAKAVAHVGPISVAIDAGHRSFQMYKGGIYNEPNCSPTLLDHGVLVVGYGVQNNQNYWIVKNSWGASWGDSGYIKMSKDKNNQCGIATMASYPF